MDALNGSLYFKIYNLTLLVRIHDLVSIWGMMTALNTDSNNSVAILVHENKMTSLIIKNCEIKSNLADS